MFKIIGRLLDGSIEILFHWVGPQEQGIRQAQKEAEHFGIHLLEIWAEEWEG